MSIWSFESPVNYFHLIQIHNLCELPNIINVLTTCETCCFHIERFKCYLDS